MKVREIVTYLKLDVKAGADGLDNEITGGYASDLLSDVIANSQEGNLWVTLQIHKNVLAVASLKELAGIILVNGREPDKETLQKAVEEKIPVLTSNLPAFEVIGRLYALGITGKSSNGEAL